MNSGEKRNLKLFASYGVGYMADACCYQFCSSYLLVFLTTISGLSASDAGTIVSVIILADAVFSIVIGRVSDNLRSKYGRRRPILLASGIGLPLCLFLLFRTVPFSGGLKMGYYMLFGFLFWMFFAAFYISYSALGADVAPGYDERITLNSFTRVANIGASLLSMAAPLSIVAFFIARGFSQSGAWSALALIMALVSAFGILSAWNGTRGLEKTVYEEVKHQGIKAMVSDFRELLTIKPFVKLIASKITSNICYNLFNGVLVFYVTYVMGAGANAAAAAAATVYTLSSVINFLFIIVVSKIAMAVGKRMATLLGTLACGIASLIVFFFGIKSLPVLMIYTVFYQFGQSSFWQLYNTNLYDITDLDQYRHNVRREGNIVALQSLIGTVAVSLTLKGLTALLSISGFDASLSVQSSSAISMLEVIFILLPAAFSILCALIMKSYRVEKEGFILLKDALFRRETGMAPLPESDLAKIENMFR